MRTVPFTWSLGFACLALGLFLTATGHHAIGPTLLSIGSFGAGYRFAFNHHRDVHEKREQ